jgi:Fic family protein
MTMLNVENPMIKKAMECYNSSHIEDSANALRSLFTGKDGFSIFDAIREMDTMIIIHDDGDEEITRYVSFSHRNDKNYLVLSASRSVEQMRFDAACMLRRVMKGLTETKSNKCPNITTLNRKFDREDKHFACALLMPQKDLMRFITRKDENGKYLYLNAKGELSFENINIVADHFGVPFDQCCSRIFNVFETLKEKKKANFTIKGCYNKKVYKELKAKYTKEARERDMKRLVPEHEKHREILTRHLIDSLHYRSYDRLSDIAKRRILVNLTISDSVNEGVIIDRTKEKAEKKALAILNNYISSGIKVKDGYLLGKNGSSIPLTDEQLVVIGEYDLYNKTLEDGLLLSIARLGGNPNRFDGMSYADAINSLTERDMVNFIKDIHDKLFSKLSEKYDEKRGGMFRTGSVNLRGTNVDVPSSYMVPQIMGNIAWRLLDTLKKSVNGNISNSEYVDQINSCIYEMIRTQPFEDGNKRTSRLLSNILYQEKGLPYVLLPVKEWDNYVDAWSNNNIDLYNRMMHRLILESYNYFYGCQSVGNAVKSKMEGTKLINANRK